jgi:hypothetical protein
MPGRKAKTGRAIKKMVNKALKSPIAKALGRKLISKINSM